MSVSKRCNEPACPFPSSREGFCPRHWLLHRGSYEQLCAPKTEAMEGDLIWPRGTVSSPERLLQNARCPPRASDRGRPSKSWARARETVH
jgi:hypothetical protein